MSGNASTSGRATSGMRAWPAPHPLLPLLSLLGAWASAPLLSGAASPAWLPPPCRRSTLAWRRSTLARKSRSSRPELPYSAHRSSAPSPTSGSAPSSAQRCRKSGSPMVPPQAACCNWLLSSKSRWPSPLASKAANTQLTLSMSDSSAAAAAASTAPSPSASAAAAAASAAATAASSSSSVVATVEAAESTGDMSSAVGGAVGGTIGGAATSAGGSSAVCAASASEMVVSASDPSGSNSNDDEDATDAAGVTTARGEAGGEVAGELGAGVEMAKAATPGGKGSKKPSSSSPSSIARSLTADSVDCASS
mmetsp:Transcript_27001/g.89621  ORF Transcript_27001/g.89621 Transcript_27001/m.89621 type:complete len:308 (+) Transcript_27001:278-1201(+)